MTFALSKILWAITAPANLLIIMLVVGVARLHSRRQRGRGLVTLAALGLVAIAVLPCGEWLLSPLEVRFPQPALPPHVDGIILLGGAVETDRAYADEQIALNGAAERVVEFLRLARRYPEARLLISGGSGELFPSGESEAEDTRTLLVQQGLAPDRITLEKRSRNTYENAVFSKEVARPQAGETWLMVTSASHMPRAAGCFWHVGWRVLPYPTDYRAVARPRLGFAFAEHLTSFDLAVKEWVGLVAYHLLGRIDAWFPGPQ